MHIAVLGLGNMGSMLARRLLSGGHDVTVHNRTAQRAAPLAELGAHVAATAADAAAAAAVTFVSVRDDAAVTSVIDELAAAGITSPVVNCTTCSPATTTALSRRYPTLVASPILGAPRAVQEGTATYLVAGPSAITEQLDSVWPALTDRVVRLGDDPARASVVKVLSNHLLLTGLVALAEAVAVAQANAIPDDMLSELLHHSPVVAPALRNRLDDLINGDHDGWFDTPLGAKDLQLFTDLADTSGVPTHLAPVARDRYLTAAREGLDHVDVAAVIELLRRTPPGTAT